MNTGINTPGIDTLKTSQTPKMSTVTNKTEQEVGDNITSGGYRGRGDDAPHKNADTSRFPKHERRKIDEYPYAD